MKVSKINAAVSQLDSAIHLYFCDGDPVSIHTLVAASHEILCGISKAKCKTSSFHNNPYIKPKMMDEFSKIVRKHQNFFKHGNRDPDESIEFDPKITESMFIIVISLLSKVTGHCSDLCGVFNAWAWMTMPPKMFNLPMETRLMVQEFKSQLKTRSRKEFYELMIEANLNQPRRM